MNTRFIRISLKKRIFISYCLIGLFFFLGENCYASKRPVKSYGLPDWLRVSVGTARENARFIEAFQAARKALGLI